MAVFKNITGELTQELLAAGDNIDVTSISLVNINGALPCTVDLYIEKKINWKVLFNERFKPTNRFYFRF